MAESRIIGGKAAAAHELEVDDGSDGQRLDNFLLRELKGVPKTHVYRVIRSGEVRLNKGRASADTRVAVGDRVRVPPIRRPQAMLAAAATAPPREFAVLFEDEQLLAIDKPAGTAVHGGSGVSFGVIEQLRRALPQARFLELVHRLDKDTSGILLLARKRSALTALQDQFRARDTVKVYLALVAGAWPRRLKVIDLPLVRTHADDGGREVRVALQHAPRSEDERHAGVRRSISIVEVLRPVGPYTLLAVTIKTGRTHQIRVHLAHHGHPIVGDPRYGDFALNKALARERRFDRMFLHAHRLGFDHPADGRRIELVSALPAECEQLLAST